MCNHPKYVEYSKKWKKNASNADTPKSKLTYNNVEFPNL